MKKISCIIACAIAMSFCNYAQSAGDENKLKFELSGFVRSDAFVDSRQTISLRDNAIMVVPAAKLNDIKSEDINASTNLTMVSLQTRLGGKVTGLEALGSKVTGYFEGEFFGMSDNDINGFRLRHAYVKFDWKNTSVLFGQYWHPMFCLDVIPSYNFAAPFIPYSRNPQIRITQKFNNNISLALTAMTERDFQSFGPDASNASVKSNAYLKNAVLPMMDLQLFAKYDGLILGASADYKSLMPRIRAQDGTKTTEKINSFSGTVFGKVNITNNLSLKLQGVYGQNLANLTMGGGYAIQADDSTKFTNLNVATAWGELSYGTDVTYSLFAGYSKSLGTDDNTNGKYFAFLTNVGEVIRIAPNIAFYFSKLKIVSELDYTAATYGNINIKDKSKLIDTYRAENVRFSVSCIYPF